MVVSAVNISGEGEATDWRGKYATHTGSDHWQAFYIRASTGRSVDSLCSSSSSSVLRSHAVGYWHDLFLVSQTPQTLLQIYGALHWPLGPSCSKLFFSVFWRWLSSPEAFLALQSRSSFSALRIPLSVQIGLWEPGWRGSLQATIWYRC